MATKARQQYFADEISLQKDSREFSIEDSIKQKIDSVEAWAQVNTIETVKVNWTALTPDANKAVDVEVPEVIDNLYTTSTDDALSAKQWKVLYDYIQNIASRWRFLSNWNSATGLPMTNPSESPYTYRTWDYFIVSNIAWLWGTNYRPDGSSYTIWQASTVAETDSVDVSDFYFYDGTNWLLLKNSARSWAVDSSLSTSSTNPVENRVVTNALNWKHPWEISNTAPANPVEWMLWYDTVNDELKTYDWTAWTTEWTKMVVLEYGVSTWQNFIDAYNENAIVYCKVSSWGSGYRMAFMAYTAWTTVPTEVEFQYYRSRSSHSQSSTQLDEVYVYKLTNAWVWTTTQRDTWAGMIAWTWIWITFNSSWATINNNWVTSVNSQTWAVTLSIPTNVSDLNNDSGFITWITSWDVTNALWYTPYDASNPSGYTNNTWDVVWPASSTDWHLAVFDWATWKLIKDWGAIPTWVPAVWSNGQVLTVVSWAAAWANASWWDVLVSTQANNILTSWMKIWAWTETNYTNLWTYDSNCLYLTIE